MAAYASGWPDAHNTPLNNPFDLTYAGGNNIQFSSVSSAINYFAQQYGPQLQGATSVSDFEQRMEGELNGVPQPGWHKYNSVNASWQNGVSSVINNMSQHEQLWLQGH